jgi:ATP-dependent Lon protease
VPKGAVPKDGPSAGVSIFSAVASIFTQRKVKGTLAMTGEITLRGLVLPVGGIKEKVLAAKRSGIKKVLLPKKNEKDVAEIEEDVIGDLEVQYLERMDPLLGIVLEEEPVMDPKERFKVSDEYKTRNGSSQPSKDSTEETIIMEQ